MLSHSFPLTNKVNLFCKHAFVRRLSTFSTTGHFCTLGSAEPSPVSQPYGDVCPMGHFCPQGSGSPKPCPAGSFLPDSGAFSLSHCRPCPPGKYCGNPGASQPSGGGYQLYRCSKQRKGSSQNKTKQTNQIR